MTDSTAQDESDEEFEELESNEMWSKAQLLDWSWKEKWPTLYPVKGRRYEDILS